MCDIQYLSCSEKQDAAQMIAILPLTIVFEKQNKKFCNNLDNGFHFISVFGAFVSEQKF